MSYLTPAQIHAINSKLADKQAGRKLHLRHKFPNGSVFLVYKYRVVAGQYHLEDNAPISAGLVFGQQSGTGRRLKAGYKPKLIRNQYGGYEYEPTPRDAMVEYPIYPVIQWIIKAGYFEKFGNSHVPAGMPQSPELEAWLGNSGSTGIRPDWKRLPDYPSGRLDDFSKYPPFVRAILGLESYFFAQRPRLDRQEPDIRDYGELEPLPEEYSPLAYFEPRVARREPNISADIQPEELEEPELSVRDLARLARLKREARGIRPSSDIARGVNPPYVPHYS